MLDSILSRIDDGHTLEKVSTSALEQSRIVSEEAQRCVASSAQKAAHLV